MVSAWQKTTITRNVAACSVINFIDSPRTCYYTVSLVHNDIKRLNEKRIRVSTHEGDPLGVSNEVLFSDFFFFFVINLRQGDLRLLKGYDVFVPGSKLRILINEA